MPDQSKQGKVCWCLSSSPTGLLRRRLKETQTKLKQLLAEAVLLRPLSFLPLYQLYQGIYEVIKFPIPLAICCITAARGI